VKSLYCTANTPKLCTDSY